MMAYCIEDLLAGSYKAISQGSLDNSAPNLISNDPSIPLTMEVQKATTPAPPQDILSEAEIMVAQSFSSTR
jgi:hypothetical protein